MYLLEAGFSLNLWFAMLHYSWGTLDSGVKSVLKLISRPRLAGCLSRHSYSVAISNGDERNLQQLKKLQSKANCSYLVQLQFTQVQKFYRLWPSGSSRATCEACEVQQLSFTQDVFNNSYFHFVSVCQLRLHFVIVWHHNTIVYPHILYTPTNSNDNLIEGHLLWLCMRLPNVWSSTGVFANMSTNWSCTEYLLGTIWTPQCLTNASVPEDHHIP